MDEIKATRVACVPVSSPRLASALVVAEFIDPVAVAARDTNEPSSLVVDVLSLHTSVRRIPAPFEDLAISMKNGRAVFVGDRLDRSVQAISLAIGECWADHRCSIAHMPK